MEATPESVTRWEHLVVELSEDEDEDWALVTKRLDSYGARGWELVTYEFRPLVEVRRGSLLGPGTRIDTTSIRSSAVFRRPRQK